MSSRRTTNNSAATLDEQNLILEEVLARNDLEIAKSKDKKKISKKKKEGSSEQTSKSPEKGTKKKLAQPPLRQEGAGGGGQGEEIEESESEDQTDFWDYQSQMQAQALQYQNYGNFVPNYTFGLPSVPTWQGDWSGTRMATHSRATHSVSDEDSEAPSVTDQGSEVVELPQDSQVEVKSTGKLAEFMKEQLVQVKDADRVAPKLDTEVAVVLNKILKESVYVSEMDKLSKDYPRIENVENMRVPRLDPEIFDVIDQKVRNMDQGLQNIQKAVMGAVSAIAPVLALTYSREETDAELNSLGRQLGESVKLLGHASNALSAKRRELIKPCLAPVYAKTLTKGHETSPEWLFGGDLVNTTRKCEVSQKIGEKILKRKQPVATQAKQESAKRFKGPRGPGMFRAFTPVQMFNPPIRMPCPQMFQPIYQPQNHQGFGMGMGYQRPYRPRQQYQQNAQQGFPKKQNYPAK